MKNVGLVSIYLISTILFLNVTICVATIKISVTEQEERRAQKTAQKFVRQFQKTRDVRLLTKAFFLDDFISHFVSDESISPKLYTRLTKRERFRLFIADWNTMYLTTIDVLWRPERRYVSDEEEFRLALQSILPNELAERVKSVVFSRCGLRATSYQDFKLCIPKMEKVLAESRLHLIKQGIEQTSEFQKRLDDTITNEGINYRIMTYIGGDNIHDCKPLVGFPKNQKFYRVETPLMLGVILIKVKNQMKIVRLTTVDGD